jgi:hypothetical protein
VVLVAAYVASLPEAVMVERTGQDRDDLRGGGLALKAGKDRQREESTGWRGFDGEEQKKRRAQKGNPKGVGALLAGLNLTGRTKPHPKTQEVAVFFDRAKTEVAKSGIAASAGTRGTAAGASDRAVGQARIRSVAAAVSKADGGAGQAADMTAGPTRMEVVKPNLADVGAELLIGIIKSGGVHLSKKLVEKLAKRLTLTSNPLGGVVALTKSAWDLLDFFSRAPQDEFAELFSYCVTVPRANWDLHPHYAAWFATNIFTGQVQP